MLSLKLLQTLDTYNMNIQSIGMRNLTNLKSEGYNSDEKSNILHSQKQQGVTYHELKSKPIEYNFRSMTENERLKFANEAVSSGAISLKEAGALLPPRLQRVEGPNGFKVQEQSYPEHHRFDVIEELKNSIDFSKKNGGSKGLEIRENLLTKLEHLSQGVSVNLKA